MPKTPDFKKKSAQDIQDGVFLKMSAEKKITMVGNLFELAKELNPRYLKRHGTEKVAHRHSANIRRS